jgi:hypothetical protein
MFYNMVMLTLCAQPAAPIRIHSLDVYVRKYSFYPADQTPLVHSAFPSLLIPLFSRGTFVPPVVPRNECTLCSTASSNARPHYQRMAPPVFFLFPPQKKFKNKKNKKQNLLPNSNILLIDAVLMGMVSLFSSV